MRPSLYPYQTVSSQIITDFDKDNKPIGASPSTSPHLNRENAAKVAELYSERKKIAADIKKHHSQTHIQFQDSGRKSRNLSQNGMTYADN